MRRAIEVAVEEELIAALGARRYERTEGRRGYRNGTKPRTLTGPTGPLELALPRAARFRPAGGEAEWVSTVVPRDQRRLREVNEAVMGVYLAGGHTRPARGARAIAQGAPLSRSAVSRIVGTLKAELEAWQVRSLAVLDVVYLYLDAIALRVRSAGRVASVPVLAAVAVLADGQKQLLGLERCGRETTEAWQGVLDALVVRQLKAPLLCIIDGHPGLRRAVGEGWPRAEVQRGSADKLRNLERKAPQPGSG